MGAGGEDVKLSPAARRMFKAQFECKSLAKIAVYEHYKQALAHGAYNPIVIIKQNNCKPLAVVDADWLLKNLKDIPDA